MGQRRIAIIVAVLAAAAALVVFTRSETPSMEDDVGLAAAAGGQRAGAHETNALDHHGGAAVSPDVDGSIVAVVALNGAPVAGARVRLYALHDEKWERLTEQQTDARGEARFGAHAGEFLVTAHVDGHPPAQADVVRPWRVAETRVTLDISAAAVLEGRVSDARTAQPIANARVHAALRAGDDPQPPESDEAVTDASGRFRVDALAAGLYRVSASADGYGETTVDAVRVPAGALELALDRGGGIDGVVVDASGHAAADAEVRVDGKHARATARSDRQGAFRLDVAPGLYQVSAKLGSLAGREEHVNVGAAHRTAVRVVLEAAGSLAGRVTVKTSGAAVSGAKLELRETGTDFAYLTSSTDGLGRYQFEGLPPGDYTLRVNADGFTQRERWHLIVLAGQAYPCDVELEALSGLQGRVLDAHDHGVAGAQVQLEASDQQQRSTVTDGAGAFSFGDLPAGGLRVAARSGSGAQTSKRLSVAGGDTAHVELVLGEGGVLTGHVKLASGRPLERGFRIYARPQTLEDKTERHVDVGEDGSYLIPLQPAKYAVAAIGIGDPSQRSPPVATEITADHTTTVDLTIVDQPEHGLHGTVNEPDGTPSVEARVWAQLADPKAHSRWLGQGTTDATGHFDLAVQLPENQPAIELHARNGGRVAVVTGSYPDGADVTVTLQRGAHLFGEVKDPDGKPVQQVTIKAAPHDGNAAWYAPRLDFSGSHYDLPEVGAEPLTVQAWTGDGRTGSAQVTPGPGQDTRLDITLQASAKLVGKVVDEKGQLTSAEVRLLRADGTTDATASTTLPPVGEFQFGGRAPGDYKLQVRKAYYRWTTVPVKLTAGQTSDVGTLTVKPATTQPGKIGVSFILDAGAVRIVEVLPDSPAAQAGIVGGEILIAVNGERVASVADATRLVPGAPGTVVVLTLSRGGAVGDVSVTRAP